MKILLIEKSGYTRKLLKDAIIDNRILPDESFLQEAIDGARGLELFNSFKPHVVVMETNLSDVKGLDLCLQFTGINPDCKIIIVSNSNVEGIADEAIRYGAVKFFSKPFQVQSIVSYIKTLNIPTESSLPAPQEEEEFFVDIIEDEFDLLSPGEEPVHVVDIEFDDLDNPPTVKVDIEKILPVDGFNIKETSSSVSVQENEEIIDDIFSDVPTESSHDDDFGFEDVVPTPEPEPEDFLNFGGLSSLSATFADTFPSEDETDDLDCEERPLDEDKEPNDLSDVDFFDTEETLETKEVSTTEAVNTSAPVVSEMQDNSVDSNPVLAEDLEFNDEDSEQGPFETQETQKPPSSQDTEGDPFDLTGLADFSESRPSTSDVSPKQTKTLDIPKQQSSPSITHAAPEKVFQPNQSTKEDQFETAFEDDSACEDSLQELKENGPENESNELMPEEYFSEEEELQPEEDESSDDFDLGEVEEEMDDFDLGEVEECNSPEDEDANSSEPVPLLEKHSVQNRKRTVLRRVPLSQEVVSELGKTEHQTVYEKDQRPFSIKPPRASLIVPENMQTEEDLILNKADVEVSPEEQQAVGFLAAIKGIFSGFLK